MKDVISKEQRLLNQKLHSDSKDFGNREDGSGVAFHLSKALARMHELGVCNSMLDYGTGKGKLVNKIRKDLGNIIKVDGYDPAVQEWDNKPSVGYDIVTCLDVLEHIELASIDAVISDIAEITKKFSYLVIDLQPAVKTLADGRNAHILLAPSDWWASRIAQKFECHALFPIKHVSGITQKIVVAAAHDPEILPIMYGFLIKMKLFDFKMTGGSLGGVKK